MGLTKHIWSEDIYRGTIAGTSVFVRYFNIVAEEFGIGKVVELLKKLGMLMGSNTGMTFKMK